MSRDSDRRIRNEVEAILSTHGITYQHITRGRHPAVQFQVNGKTLCYSYGNGGDPRAHLNARTQLRNMLRSLGIHSSEDDVTTPAPPPVIAAASLNGDASEAHTEAVIDHIEQENVVDDSEPLVETEEILPQVPPAVVPPATAAPTPIAATPNHTYQSSKVLGIKLERDLLVSAGNMLVIPLNKPTTVMEMTEEQFRMLFSEVEEPPSPPPDSIWSRPDVPVVWAGASRQKRSYNRQIIEAETEASQPRITDDAAAIMAYLATRKGAVKTETIANVLLKTRKSIDAHLRRMANRRLVEQGPIGFWALVPEQVPPPLPPKEIPRPLGRSAGPIPPQIGRMLLAMINTRRLTNKDDLSLAMVGTYLDERDFRQYSARMPNAIKLGLVEQGLPNPTGRGYLYKLTQKAYDLMKDIKGWPYEVEGISPPPWLSYLF